MRSLPAKLASILISRLLQVLAKSLWKFNMLLETQPTELAGPIPKMNDKAIGRGFPGDPFSFCMLDVLVDNCVFLGPQT